MKQKRDKQGRREFIPGERLDKVVYLSKELIERLESAARADGFEDWRVWINERLPEDTQ